VVATCLNGLALVVGHGGQRGLLWLRATRAYQLREWRHHREEASGDEWATHPELISCRAMCSGPIKGLR